MKQLLFFLLFPCLAMAQYQGNGNQKITLGEQTTADGLVYRGVANDTNVITPFSDTSAYIILDTVDSKFYHYNRTTTYWSLAGGGGDSGGVTSFSAGTTGLTPSTATTGAVTLGGTLAVANGGTGASTFTEGSVVFAGASGTYTQDNSGLFFDNTNNRLGINTAAPSGLLEARSTVGGTQNGLFSLYESSGTAPYFSFLKARGTVASPTEVLVNDEVGRLFFQGYKVQTGASFFATHSYIAAYNHLAPSVNGYLNGGIKIGISSNANGGTADYFNIISDGKTGIGTNLVPTERLHVGGNVRISGLANASNPVAVEVDVNGVLARTSSINIKEDVQNLPYGLNEVMLLQPSKFSYIDKYKYGEGYDIGFIAEDVNDVIPEAVGTGVDSEVFMDKSKLIPVLVKAIQEQNLLIKALEQRILILENK